MVPRSTTPEFQSTLPVWGATERLCASDRDQRYFNPRSPCGERRPVAAQAHGGQPHFNPRSPCGERRDIKAALESLKKISIHAPRVGSDRPCAVQTARPRGFQSTLPVWGATAKLHNSSPAILRKSDNSLLFLPDFHRPDNFMEHTSAP